MQSSADVHEAVRKRVDKGLYKVRIVLLRKRQCKDVGEPSKYKYEVQAHGFLRIVPNRKQDITYANGCCNFRRQKYD
jgi:hypothetical protein